MSDPIEMRRFELVETDGTVHQPISKMEAHGPGAFHWSVVTRPNGVDVKAILVVTPDGGFSLLAVNGPGLPSVPLVVDGIKQGATWDWDGDEDNPTLAPSIKTYGNRSREGRRSSMGWHGWMRQGKLVTA